MNKILGLIFLLMAGVFCGHRHFDFGVATSAFQTEGAWLEDGKSLTIWDDYDHTQGFIIDNSTADIAADSYHKFREDIAIMKEYGIKHYRMSVAWSRILPNGVAGSKVNMKAIEHYRDMLKALKEAGITAYANLHHNDLPAILRIEAYAGALDEEFITHFVYYADVCFSLLGDLVKYWFTFDEPWVLSIYDKMEPDELNTKPYKLAHNYLLAHASAVKLYREKYQKTQGGQVGMNLLSEMCWPTNASSPEDIEASKRHIKFQLGWFAEPLMKGDYPEVMKQSVGDRLPKFTPEQKELVKGSIDFFCLNHYFSWMVAQGNVTEGHTYWDDINVTKTFKEDWRRTDMNWPIVPEGIHDLLVFLNQEWVEGKVPIWVTENGVAVKEPSISAAINDHLRIDYISEYIGQVAKAVEEGVNVQKYFAWSLVDNFEWWSGVAKRFGFTFIDYGDDPKRIPKSSIKWYGQLIKQFSD